MIGDFTFFVLICYVLSKIVTKIKEDEEDDHDWRVF